MVFGLRAESLRPNYYQNFGLKILRAECRPLASAELFRLFQNVIWKLIQVCQIVYIIIYIIFVRWGKFVVTFLKFLRLVLFGDKKWRNFYVHAALKNMCIDQI